MAEMKSIRVILYVALFGWVSSFSQNTTLRERIPACLQQLCPGSGVCLNDIIDPDDDMPSCCGACSCSKDCEIKGNCCFQTMNNNTIGKSPTTQKYSECLYPVVATKQTQVGDGTHQSYIMISSSRNDAIINEMTNNTVSCGEIEVAPWGSMFPVYSKSTGKIYKNMVCAYEHNVTDGELWDFYISCYKYDIDFMSKFQDGFMPEYCAVHFFYEGGMSMLKSEQCYLKAYYKDKCNYNRFEIPAFLPVTREEIVAACESGLVSPNKFGYANIFCDICNRNSSVLFEDNPEHCTDANDIEENLARAETGLIPFTVIFDASAFSKSFIEDYIKTENARIACPKDSKTQTGDGCRTISCPIGQLFSDEDVCIYPGNKWFTQRIHIKISLQAERTINISNLLRSKQNLKSPWPKTWVMEVISYETSRIFVLQYIRLNRPFNPKSFFAMVNYYISKQWLLVSNNETIKLLAEITKFIKDVKWQRLTSKVITLKYRLHGLRMRPSIFITKLFFCQRVTLLPLEYAINQSIGSLFNRITNETLLEAEYMVVENEHGVSPVVCLEDSGLYRVSTSNANEITFRGIVLHYLAIILSLKIIF